MEKPFIRETNQNYIFENLEKKENLINRDIYSDLISVNEMCNMLGIGKNTAYTILNNKKIKAFRIGRIWKIPRQSVIDYIYNSSCFN